MFKNIILQLHGGGGSQSQTQKWVPNQYQSQILDAMLPQYSQYQQQSQNLLGAVPNMYNGLATQAIDYGSMLNTAQNQNMAATNGLNGLAQGNVAGFVGNESAALQSALTNTMGTQLNNWAKNGVINSSVATAGMNSIAQQSAAQAAGDYNNAFSNALNANGQQFQAANAPISTASTAQNAAQLSASNLLTDSLSAYNAGSGILGTGVQGATTSTSNGGQWLNTIAAIGAGAMACFAEDTKIETPYGEKYIQCVEVGDIVLGCEDGKIVPHEVVEVQEPVEQEIIEVVTEDEEKQRHFIETTITQPLMKKDGAFIVVKDVTIGTELMLAGKVVAIMSMGKDLVYDLRTTGNNTYIANGVIAYGRF